MVFGRKFGRSLVEKTIAKSVRIFQQFSRFSDRFGIRFPRKLSKIDRLNFIKNNTNLHEKFTCNER